MYFPSSGNDLGIQMSAISPFRIASDEESDFFLRSHPFLGSRQFPCPGLSPELWQFWGIISFSELLTHLSSTPSSAQSASFPSFHSCWSQEYSEKNLQHARLYLRQLPGDPILESRIHWKSLNLSEGSTTVGVFGYGNHLTCPGCG